MLAVRLSEELETDLGQYAQATNRTKSDVVKEALTHYLDAQKRKEEATPYQLGEELFGRYGSGDGDRSVTYKQRLKAKLRASRTAR
jgi:predicted transcriptional regulator